MASLEISENLEERHSHLPQSERFKRGELISEVEIDAFFEQWFQELESRQ